MAEKAAKSGDAGPSVVDLQSDVRWQERLSEARERRAQAMKEMGRNDGARRQPRKPWEDEATEGREVLVELTAKAEKEFDFLDRMDVLKRVTGLDKNVEAEPTASKPMPGRNWFPGAGERADETSAIEAKPDDATPLDEPTQSPIVEDDIVRPTIRSRTPVDKVFDEPNFGYDVPEAPVSLLLQLTDPPPPPSASRPWLQQKDKVEFEVLAAPEAAKPTASSDSTARNRKRLVPAWIGLAALFLIAIGTGPLVVYSPWQPRAVIPVPPYFGLQPALGLTSPLIGLPSATSANDRRPASDTAPKLRLPANRPRPPSFLRIIAPFDALPPGAPTAGVDLPPAATALPNARQTAPAAPRLALSVIERISGDPTRLVALPSVLAGVSFDAIQPVPRPVLVPLTQ